MGKRDFRFWILLAFSIAPEMEWNWNLFFMWHGQKFIFHVPSLTLALSTRLNPKKENWFAFTQFTYISSSVLIPKWYQMKSRKIKLLQHSRFWCLYMLLYVETFFPYHVSYLWLTLCMNNSVFLQQYSLSAMNAISLPKDWFNRIASHQR